MQSEGKKKQTTVLQQADFFKNDTQHLIYEELLLSSMGWQSTGKTVKKKKKMTVKLARGVTSVWCM